MPDVAGVCFSVGRVQKDAGWGAMPASAFDCFAAIAALSGDRPNSPGPAGLSLMEKYLPHAIIVKRSICFGKAPADGLASSLSLCTASLKTGLWLQE